VRKKFASFLKGICIPYLASQAVIPRWAAEKLPDYLEHRVTLLQHRGELVDNFYALHCLVREQGYSELPEDLVPLLEWIGERAAKPIHAPQVS
jgi:hypothetical protein